MVLRDRGRRRRRVDGLGAVPCILEGFVAFDRELSIIAVRGRDGEVACWPAVENHHRDGILRLTRAPAPGLDDALQARAEAAIRPLLDDLDYVGVCCVELFDVGGELLANEIAPRVHNSGHWTIEGAATSQFENHVRADRRPAARLDRGARSERDGELHRHDARPRRAAAHPGRAPARLRQGRRGPAASSVTSPSPRPTPTSSSRGSRRCASYATAPVSRSFATSAAAIPQSASASSVCWPGHGAERCTSPAVRENRGAGAGCGTPSRSMIVWRAFMCASFVASLIVSTGA